MPLFIGRESRLKHEDASPGSCEYKGLGGLSSNKKISAQSDLVGLNGFMREMSSLLSQDQVQPCGAERSAR
ncbi:MAG: hypothetical protein HQL67_05255 [Magnetococcales bacterium]|nr:hypothetical protein [Magnetococcales bacterium]